MNASGKHSKAYGVNAVANGTDAKAFCLPCDYVAPRRSWRTWTRVACRINRYGEVPLWLVVMFVLLGFFTTRCSVPLS